VTLKMEEIQQLNEQEMDSEGLIMPTIQELRSSQAYKDVLTELRETYPSSIYRRLYAFEFHPEFRYILMLVCVERLSDDSGSNFFYKFTKLKETNDIESI
jgi:hypothetical protein